MKKLCLVFLSLCLSLNISVARAEKHFEYIRIECHQMLGILDVSYNDIYSSALKRIFLYEPEYVMYQDETTDVLAIDKNVFLKRWKDKKFEGTPDDVVYRYSCPLIGAKEGVTYDVLLKVCPSEKQDDVRAGCYSVSIVENKKGSQTDATERKLIDDVRIGSEADVDRVVMTGDGDFDNLTFHFEKSKHLADEVRGEE